MAETNIKDQQMRQVMNVKTSRCAIVTRGDQSTCKVEELNPSECEASSSLLSPCGDLLGEGCLQRMDATTEGADIVYDSSQVAQRYGNVEDSFESLPDHLIIEVLIQLPSSCWASAACVRKRWATLFRSDLLWQCALLKRWPHAGKEKRWPGPIGRGSSKRRYTALHVSKSLFKFGDTDGDVDELAGHVYLFLKEQLTVSPTPLSYGLLHGTVIDQFLACGKSGNAAYELASQIWLAVIDKLDDSEDTFHLLMRIAEEWEVFLPYPYSKSHSVQWRLFERLFTDFRDCLTQFDYYNVLTCAKHKFELIPPTWLGY